MANSPKESPARQIAQALVDFSVDGSFPEETVVALAVDSTALPSAIEALASAKSKLQVAPRLPLSRQSPTPMLRVHV